MDANYLVMPVFIARDAGLGDIGRNAILTNKDYGSRLRLGVVTTDIPLLEDEYVDFGLEDFCKVCKNALLTALLIHFLMILKLVMMENIIG